MVKCNKETGITFKVGMQQGYVLLKNYDKSDKQLVFLLQRYYGKEVKFKFKYLSLVEDPYTYIFYETFLFKYLNLFIVLILNEDEHL